jgi:hypothetical protein
MSASIRLSLKAARNIQQELREIAMGNFELDAAIAKAERTSSRRALARKPKESKRKQKREETFLVRAEVFRRANGVCECGCGRPLTTALAGGPTLDHFFGRARAESIETCWALRWDCHVMKTENRPSATSWLDRFVTHCRRHMYLDTALKAMSDLRYARFGGGQ